MYKVKFTKKVIKQFSKLPVQKYDQVFSGIISLSLDPLSEAIDTTKLTDEDQLYRLRVGDYRVIYSPNHDKKELNIKSIAQRKDAYKKK